MGQFRWRLADTYVISPTIVNSSGPSQAIVWSSAKPAAETFGSADARHQRLQLPSEIHIAIGCERFQSWSRRQL